MKIASSYLSHLRFDQKLKNSLQARFLSNPRLVVLLVLGVLIAGISSYLRLPRQLNPDIEIPLVVVSSVLPGAGPQDVESLITVPIEDAVTGVEGVKDVQSTSRDSVSFTTIEFESNVDSDKARTDVQSAVDSVEIPDDAQTPVVHKIDFQNQPVWTFTITGRDDPVSLSRFAKRLETAIEEEATIDKVDISGLDEQEVQIVLRPQAITTYGLNPLSLQQLISSATGSYPAGTVQTETGSFTLTIDPAIVSVSDIRELVVSVNGIPVPLSEIAQIQERSKPDQQQTYYATAKSSPKESITLNVFKSKTTNINKAVSDAEKVVDEQLESTHNQFAIQTITNTSEEVEEQFSELIRDFWIIITLVFIMLFVFLGLRQAIVAAISAPLTFLITFVVMDLTGITLNFLSLFSLLLALGLLVDDTIVVVSAMTAYYRTKKFTPFETGLLVWRDFMVAVFTTTITTVWAFLPLLLASGIIGEFIKSIPIVVSTTLLASFFVAMFLILPMIIILLKPQLPRRVVIFLRVVLLLVLLGIFFAIIPKGPWIILEVLALIVFLWVTKTVRDQLVSKGRSYISRQARTQAPLRVAPSAIDNGLVHFDVIASRYRKVIQHILTSPKARKNTIIMVIIFSLFSYLLLPLGFVKNEFFPRADYPLLYLSVELPSGTNAKSTEKEAVRLLNQVKDTQGLEFATATVGQSFNTQEGGTSGSESNNILVTLTLKDEHDRDVSSLDVADSLREEFAGYEKGRLSVNEVSGGPPAGSDLQIQLKGSDLVTLTRYAEKMETFMKQQEGITNVNKSVAQGTSKVVFVPDKEKLAQQGMSAGQLGIWLRLFASGITADTIKFSDDGNVEKDITIRMSSDAQSLDAVGSLHISTQNGNVPLSQLGTLRLEPNPTVINRENGDRVISVSAAVEQGYNIPEQNTKVEQYARTDLNLPEGYSWETGGVNEENQASVNSILQAMLLSFLLIVITMVLQFSSFRKAIIVMLVIPLSISGVFILFAVTGTPLSFPALIGVLALFGIVVKNSILIVDKIGQNEKAGMDFVDSIVDASSSRLEAIALTSMTAIVGLIPITLSDPLWRGLGGAIIAGLTFSGTIMLFFIPVVYSYWFSLAKKRNLTRT